MLTREQIEQACKECGIPIDKFYKQDNELSWGAFRSTKELETFVKLFSPHLRNEQIKARDMTLEELNSFYNKLRSSKYIIGWFMSYGNLDPSLWYVVEDDYKEAIELAGGIEKFLKLKKGE